MHHLDVLSVMTDRSGALTFIKAFRFGRK